jgi:hypothetical protein
MNLLDKIQATLADLFASFNPQQALIVAQNIEQTVPSLDSPAHELLILMEDKNIKFESFLADKCLPLLRFYLAPTAMQQDIFLSQSQLAQFFSSMPVVEAYVLKEKIEITQHNLQSRNNNSVVAFPHSDNTLQVTDSVKLAQLQKSFHSEKTCAYLNCFYQLQAGKLQLVDSQQSFHQNMILYSELSPLQQLEAQTLLKQNKNIA